MAQEKEYIARLIDKELDFYLKSVGGVLIVGPKWCGKSRTAKRHAKTVIDLLKKKTRDQYVELAKKAPELLLNSGEKPILIDEWQIISFIWNSIKEAIDENGSFGQYILTGSVTDNTIDKPNKTDQERHTGTGRILKKVMRPMSLYESGDSNGTISLSELRENNDIVSVSNKTIYDYSFLICRGGWPLAINEEEMIALQQAKTFYNGLVSEDVFSLKDIPLRKDETRARKLLRSYARNLATQASNEVIKADLKESGEDIDKETFIKYIKVLERLYVVEELEAWNPNLRSKTAIREKNTRHFVDPSIAAVALGITPKSMFSDMKTFGFLFESLAIRDLRIYCDAIGAKIFHYRDKLDRETDAVIQFEDGSWALAEIKLGDIEEIKKASQKLINFANDINNKEHPKPAFLMVITGEKFAYRDDNGVFIVPLACLKP